VRPGPHPKAAGCPDASTATREPGKFRHTPKANPKTNPGLFVDARGREVTGKVLTFDAASITIDGAVQTGLVKTNPGLLF